MLVQKVWALEETGSTALGPAVLCALSLVGANGSIILCTDGFYPPSPAIHSPFSTTG